MSFDESVRVFQLLFYMGRKLKPEDLFSWLLDPREWNRNRTHLDENGFLLYKNPAHLDADLNVSFHQESCIITNNDNICHTSIYCSVFSLDTAGNKFVFSISWGSLLFIS